MSDDFDKISSFLSEHHVLSLATTTTQELSVCSLFYRYFPKRNIFIVASSEETNHIKHIQSNPTVAGNILLETKEVAKIQGVQFRGTFSELKDITNKELYFEAFPYAREMNPKLWQIDVKYFKMTDNTLGFANKIIWKDSSLQT